MKVERTEEFTITLDRDQADKLLASLDDSAPARGPLADLYLALGAMLGQGVNRDPDWIGNRPPASAIPAATVGPDRVPITPASERMFAHDGHAYFPAADGGGCERCGAGETYHVGGADYVG